MTPGSAFDGGAVPGRRGEGAESWFLLRAHRDALGWGAWGWLGWVLWAFAETHEVLPPLSTFCFRL